MLHPWIQRLRSLGLRAVNSVRLAMAVHLALALVCWSLGLLAAVGVAGHDAPWLLGMVLRGLGQGDITPSPQLVLIMRAAVIIGVTPPGVVIEVLLLVIGAWQLLSFSLRYDKLWPNRPSDQ